MKLKINESKLDRELKLMRVKEDKTSSLLADIDSSHIISILEENMKLRETPMVERLKNKLKK